MRSHNGSRTLPQRTVHKAPRIRKHRSARSQTHRQMHYAPEQPRQGVLVDERFGDVLPQQPAGVFFLVEVHTDSPGLTPHEIVEPGAEREGSRVELEAEEVLGTGAGADEDEDVEMRDA
ncbi:KLTH0F05478p [Lachancea thermotolerans CBS 6340]|uniref:KLTH0F05478p n=1 Tax=Lachancea thermotolerans (strain ATCC 56472 / CBS 6340 / NRRL Y-8284) TaxID=559295 RepID=C5DKK5_LACTC|nr:KLTH0F05478p [Lachancea thermotolerans CBS 6340]CAR24006.1 KLTH0F05478p [Lachancea thermotolerans CBS 6340]